MSKSMFDKEIENLMDDLADIEKQAERAKEPIRDRIMELEELRANQQKARWLAKKEVELGNVEVITANNYVLGNFKDYRVFFLSLGISDEHFEERGEKVAIEISGFDPRFSGKSVSLKDKNGDGFVLSGHNKLYAFRK